MSEITQNPRLDPVYRAVDNALLRVHPALEPLSRYSAEVCSGGRFDEVTRADLLEAACGAVQLANVLAAAYRDVSLLDPGAVRIAIDTETGALRMLDECREIDLDTALRELLQQEARHWGRL